jgi:Ca2+-binding RTX toxin-like protein
LGIVFLYGDDAGNDTLYGEDGNDTFVGASGSDYTDGGDGVDTIDFTYSASGVSVNLEVGLGFSGEASGDTYVSIENLIGSAQYDAVSGSGAANYIYGANGDDRIQGRGGADTLDGGDGIDELRYWDSTSGVTVRLDNNTASGGDATGDRISNFENLEGSLFGDLLTGSDGANSIYAVNGNDTVSGGAGNDSLTGGRDNDLLIGGTGADSFRFSATNTLSNSGDDRVMDFAIGADVLHIAGVSAVGGLDITQSGVDTIIRFDNAPGSITLIGVNANQLLQNAGQAFVFG